MAKRTTKKALKPVRPQLGDGVEILNAGSVLEDPITRTLETNYMPYAMSVIVSRALPEIDGFKPAHRKLLYTMYGMGLLKGARTKSANIVGSTMHLNPHGDAAIYDTMVRMGRGNESLLVPFVDSKGNFGKAYSRDMSCAAARYTEAKLEGVCEELFRDIDKETVDFVPNYDGTTTEPTLLPVTFPTILANNTLGIAVGMACNICSFNLAELCNTTIALMKDPQHDISTTMPAPDFVGGGQILYDEAQMREIYENGRGSVKVRARYNVVPGENMLEITQIPPTTTVEAIMDKIAELVKAGKIKEISDMRDETDLNGLKLTLDLKRGVDAEKLMAKLFKTTPLEDSFSANFNILVSGQPKVMGVREILQEWTAFRMECVRRRTYFDLHGKEKRLHLLKGLAAILLDIDKAIHIIRTTEEETEVVPNLMIGFGIDEVQADYVAEIKLRHLNREYILKRTSEIDQLEKDIADLNDILAKPARIRRIIIKELTEVAKKYDQPRRSEILYDLPEEESGAEEEEIPDYPVTVFFTREGYLKKIPPQSLRTSGAQKLKEGDEIIQQVETRNNVEALFFTDKQQVYKVRLNELEDGKVAQMGIFIPGRLGMDEGENILSMVITSDYSGFMLFFFESVIVSRALPEIDGFKPAHRKLLYTMYGMGLLKGARTKSANIVGSTMHLNPHGDAAIYDTMVRMGRGNESLLVPFVDSKGNFGKAYSRDMSCAAARYTEAKLEGVCEELFRDIDKETVDFVPNYDGTTTEPTLLPVTFPTILANNTLGIAVGMACNICSFNLAELCNTTIALMKDPQHDISTTMPAPDFVGGGQILYDEAQMREIYENGRGSVKVRARYNVVPGENMLEITQIPPTTTVEAIMDKIAELVKAGKIKEISDMRDETDLNGLKLTLDLKRGVDAEKLMAKLFKTTPLEDSFSANFNILVSGQPKVMGVREILQEWTAFRMECVRRRTYFDLHGKEKRLHLLKGLAAILLDIDKAIHIIRTTEEETEVVPNLMIGFGIDEVQADYVAEIKLRHLNREYILKRTSEIDQLEKDIADLNDILAKPARIRRIIIKELTEVAKKYDQPRRSEILYDLPEEESGAEEEEIPDYPVTVFFTREGYLKKIPPQSLRTSGAQKLKEGDEIIQQVETRNNVEALFFTDKQQVYKVRLNELEDGKVAQMGIFIPGRLGMDEGENILSMVITSDYSGFMLFFFESGKCAKIPLTSYATKQNRRKLLKAYCDKEPLSKMVFLPEETELAIRTSASRMLLVGTAQIGAKATRDSQGVAVVTLKKNQRIASVVPAETLELTNPHRYRVRSLPATGALIRAEDEGEQMSLL